MVRVRKKRRKLRVLSLFAGIEGLGRGLEETGRFEVAFQVENNEFCLGILRKRYPDAFRATDLTHLRFKRSLDGSVRMMYPAYSEDTTMAGTLKKLTQIQVDECVRMYESGMSLAPIAEYYGVSRQSMWDLLRRRTTMRAQQKYGKANHFYRGGAKADDKAQNVVEYAIRKGLLTVPTTCEKCRKKPKPMKDGRPSIQAHHADYNKPLKVKWLCQKCHHAWHKSKRPVPRREVRELGRTDMVCGGFP